MADPTDPTDVAQAVRRLLAGATPEESTAVLQALLSGRAASFLEELERKEAPSLLPVPERVRGFRVRLDLYGARPPVWRRLELPGDLLLPRLHDVIQVAMGWTDSHLHRFRTARDPRSPSLLTQFDLDEGDEGLVEDDVRLDRLVAAAGDELWYEYDFGDGWDHRLVVEEVRDEPPTTARCTAGRLSCPPEDCGGLPGFEALAAWVRSGYDAAHLPDGFDGDADAARAWLPLDWHPDDFEVAATDRAVAAVLSEPVAVTGELAELARELERVGIRRLREVLGRPASHGPAEVDAEEAARLTATYRTFLDVVGDGVTLTSAGYLPPAVVEQFAQRSGITDWWIGRANREDRTPPVAAVRQTARDLGLVGVRGGRLTPTAAARRCADPQDLWRHIVGRLPLGRGDGERQSGWMALAVAGSGTPVEAWREEVAELLFGLGWRSGYDRVSPPPAHSPTLEVLRQLAGASRSSRSVPGVVDLAVAATARAVVRRG